VIIALATLPGVVWAHGFEPGHLALAERRDGRVEARWRPPSGGEGVSDGGARVRLPRCKALPGASAERATYDCGPAGVGGAAVAFEGLGEAALVSVRYASGRRFSAVVRADAPSLTVPEDVGGSALAVARSYAALGARHVAGGLDHLAFVLGLLLLARNGPAVARAVTAFTVGHSVTLALAALGFARAPQAPVEAAIAASVALLGVELANEGRGGETLARRAPWAVAGGFGLLHGLGFADALAEAGLPEGSVATALAGFNVGVELGQLAFVAAAGLALRALGARAETARRALAYAIGAAGVCWTLQRAAAVWG